MASGQENAKSLAKFSNNVKKTALGVKFAKTLYTNPTSISPKTISLVMKELGLNIPKEIEMTIEAAQVITAGQTISDGLAAGKSMNDLGAVTKSGSASLRIVTAIAETNGMIDDDSASLIRIGTSVAMLVASGGTDVSSWVALASELANTTAAKQGLATIHAIQNAQDLYKARVSPQSKILGDTFKDFQEKKISIYGVISKMAVETPDLWPQVVNPNSPIAQAFPDLLMIPTVNASVRGVGSSEIYGDWPWPASGQYVLARWDDDKILNFQTLGKNFTRETAAQYFFELLLKPWLTAYSIANNEVVSRGNMSMQNIAILSYLVNPQGEISDRDSYVNALVGSALTPYDFNDNILDNIARQFVEDHYTPAQKIFREQAISVGLSQQNKAWNSYQKNLDEMRARLELVKQTDDITTLVQYPYIYEKLQNYLDFETVSFEKDPTLGGQVNSKFSENSVRAWRKLHNYIAVMQMIDTFRKDSYLSQTKFAEQLAPFMPSVDYFQSEITRLNYVSTMRNVNRLALKNIAGFLNVPSEKLVNVSKDSFAVLRSK